VVQFFIGQMSFLSISDNALSISDNALSISDNALSTSDNALSTSDNARKDVSRLYLLAKALVSNK